MTPHDPNPKKRKRSEISKTNEAYRNLLNTTIEEIIQPPQPPKNYTPLLASQIGLTTWTSTEKTSFFNALERLGKHDIQGIAARIGKRKSPLEVWEYISLLERGVQEVKLGIGMEEIPAALEISAECCELLDEVAGLLECKEREWEEALEMEKWGEKEWLIDWERAAKLKNQVDSRTSRDRDDPRENEAGEGREDKGRTLSKVVELLDPANFLALSNHLFMNTASPLDDNWQSIADQMKSKESSNLGVEPSMRVTGLRDFHNLTVSLTRRIVTTAHYCANSRLKATSIRGDRIKKRLVKRKDVLAALRMLGLEANSERWWEGVAGRCGVSVLEGNERQDSKNEETKDSIKSYPKIARETVEDSLEDDDSNGDSISNSSSSSSEEDSDNEKINEDEEEEEEEKGQEVEMLPITKSQRHTQPENSNSDSDSEFEDTNNPNTHPEKSTTSSSPSPPTSPKSQHSSSSSSSSPSSNAQIEALDLHNSHQEESKLWTLLNHTPPPHLHLDLNPDLNLNVKPPKIARHVVSKKREELAVERWRERMEYWSEWELMGLPVGQEEFLEVGGRRERVGGERGLVVGGSGNGSGSGALSRERVGDSDLEDEEEGEKEGGGGDEVNSRDETEDVDE